METLKIQIDKNRRISFNRELKNNEAAEAMFLLSIVNTENTNNNDAWFRGCITGSVITLVIGVILIMMWSVM